jgi:tetratricopeptide (TPR) repeat protein
MNGDRKALETEPVRGRWVEGAAADAREERAGALLRQELVETALSEPRLAAVRARLGEAKRWAPRSLAVQLALSVLVFLGLSTLVLAATRVGGWLKAREAVRRAEAVPARAPAPLHRKRGQDSEIPRASAATVAESAPPSFGPPAPPPGAVQPGAPRVPSRRLAFAGPGHGRGALVDETIRAATEAPTEPPATNPPAVEAPAVMAPPPPSALAEESALLERALRVLRQENDPRGALALFDEHARRFASGPLSVEERVGRIEALLQLGQREQALALLDPMTLPSTGPRRDMLVTRGELRAGAGRCAEALIDFGLALTSDERSDAAAERALYGRASCRARLGDAEGARADLTSYLTRFPSGRFAADARAALRP